MTNILEVADIDVTYRGRGWRTPPVKVIHGLSLSIRKGETLGLVGESGSGKTTVGRALLGLAPVTRGRIGFDGEDITGINSRRRRSLARRLSVVFQDPYSSMNPSLCVEDIISEPLRTQGSTQEISSRVRTLLDRVHLPVGSARRLPREFSGGQRQRIAIARALAVSPDLIICDEPTSALDLSTQASILRLLTEIQESSGVAYLFITHDLAVVRQISHRIAVMRHGRIVETGDAVQVSDHPSHPYAQELQLAAPVVDPALQRERRLEWLRIRGSADDRRGGPAR